MILFTNSLFIISLLLRSVTSQSAQDEIAKIPSCANKCINSAIASVNCASSDLNCQCLNQGAIIGAIPLAPNPCIISKCSLLDAANARSSFISACNIVRSNAATTTGSAQSPTASAGPSPKSQSPQPASTLTTTVVSVASPPSPTNNPDLQSQSPSGGSQPSTPANVPLPASQQSPSAQNSLLGGQAPTSTTTSITQAQMNSQAPASSTISSRQPTQSQGQTPSPRQPQKDTRGGLGPLAQAGIVSGVLIFVLCMVGSVLSVLRCRRHRSRGMSRNKKNSSERIARGAYPRGETHAFASLEGEDERGGGLKVRRDFEVIVTSEKKKGRPSSRHLAPRGGGGTESDAGYELGFGFGARKSLLIERGVDGRGGASSAGQVFVAGETVQGDAAKLHANESEVMRVEHEHPLRSAPLSAGSH